jgi:hypothetical protein
LVENMESPRSWRDVVVELAGPGAVMSEEAVREGNWTVLARLEVPGALFQMPAVDSDQAWARVALALADMRLVQSLEAAGWAIVEEVVDESTYVVARDHSGATWAVAVALVQGDRRAAFDMRLEDRADHLAFVEPLETRDPETLMAALSEQVERG